MSALLPIIEELASARDNQARAEWLLSCPFGILRMYDFTIRNRLLNAGFPEAIDYVEAVGVAMIAVRDPLTGDFTRSTRQLLAAARVDLWITSGALTSDAVPATLPAPNHDLTEL